MELTADCTRCAALCCIVPAFRRSADFAENKPAGKACRHLADHRCTIHDRLRDAGYPGCVAFDCFGAGQWLTEAGHAASAPGLLFAMRHHFQVLWLLEQARGYAPSQALCLRLDAAAREVHGRIQALDTRPVDVDVLRAVSAEVRARTPGPRADHAGADFIGADLRPHDLRGANLRGARLIGAQLQGVDLTGADLTGADLRGAHLDGALLEHALFLHPSQVASAA